MGNWRFFIRSAYAIGLVVLALTYVALTRSREDNSTTAATAAVLETHTQEQPALVAAAALIVTKTNHFREDQGKEPVDANATLTEAAGYFAHYMAKTDKHSHTADGKTPSERAQEHGYDYCLVSENIAYVFRSAGFSTDELAKQMVEIWQASPEHRANMLDPAVTETGVAVAHSGKTGRFYGVQMFGRPKSASIHFTIENQSEVPIKYSIGDRTYDLSPRNRHTHEECLPTDLTFHLPGEATGSRRILRPHDNDHFVISGSASELKIEEL